VELLGWQDRLGHIEANKLADLIAVPGDPLKDIHQLKQVIFVMKDGEAVKLPASQVEHKTSLPFFLSQPIAFGQPVFA
jgi:cytosine/adenosine deaminase-related metal-dependent hydrolase